MSLVLQAGVEPAQGDYPYEILSLGCLPIPPLERILISKLYTRRFNKFACERRSLKRSVIKNMKKSSFSIIKIAVSVYCVPAERHRSHYRHPMAGEVGHDPTT